MIMHMQDPNLPPRVAEATLGQLIAGMRSRLVQVSQALVAEHGLTAQQFWMLMVLHEHGPCCLRALAEKLWCDEPTSSRTVKGLVKSGWLVVEPDPSHGRKLRIFVHPAAKPKVQALYRKLKIFRQGLQQGVSPEDEARLRSTLSRLLHNLDTLEAQVSTSS
jgi:DNA-binding MarR family transcriptional regulator